MSPPLYCHVALSAYNNCRRIGGHGNVKPSLCTRACEVISGAKHETKPCHHCHVERWWWRKKENWPKKSAESDRESKSVGSLEDSLPLVSKIRTNRIRNSSYSCQVGERGEEIDTDWSYSNKVEAQQNLQQTLKDSTQKSDHVLMWVITWVGEFWSSIFLKLGANMYCVTCTVFHMMYVKSSLYNYLAKSRLRSSLQTPPSNSLAPEGCYRPILVYIRLAKKDLGVN